MEEDQREIMEEINQIIEKGSETERKLFLEKLKELVKTFT